MRYLALATDYDGTLAHDGRVSDDTWEALRRLRQSGRKVFLVTGRELPDLRGVCPHLELFDRVVAENGALLYRPDTREEQPLAAPPPEDFVAALRARHVPVSAGRTIVATWRPHETTVLEVIRDLGLEMQVIFNKDAVMVLPTGVNKATGLKAALKETGVTEHNVVGVGDAENDHAFLAYCECAVAVANALPMLKERVDLVTRADHGEGVVELIDKLLADDLRILEGRLTRHHILLGRRPDDDTEVLLPPYGQTVLVAGPSGSGKSTVTTGLLERLAKAGYQFCVIDPEGDYDNLEHAVVLGDPKRPPGAEELLTLVRQTRQNVVVNLLGVPLADRPLFFAGLLPRLQELRAHIGRPHWLVLDEAHHLLPSAWQAAPGSLPQELTPLLMITVHPDQLAPALLAQTTTLIAVGHDPGDTLRRLAEAGGERAPAGAPATLGRGEVLVWSRREDGRAPFVVRAEPAQTERRRHGRKYAEGQLVPERSFYFRGPEGKLRLRAHNVWMFLELADGVDDDTWLFHLGRREYSRWFREVIGDAGVAAEIEAVEGQKGPDPAASRAKVREAVERVYTAPVHAPLFGKAL